MRGLLKWFFVDRRTGAVTIAQMPNSLLWIAIASGVALWLWSPPGSPGLVLAIAFRGSLLLWSLDEILRGVNPWRRCLGAGVLIYQLTTFL